MRADRSKILRAYALNRLKADLEASPRGRAAELSRLTGFKPSTISNAKDSHRGLGDELMHALAEKVWHIDTAELERLAYEAAGKRPPTPPALNLERGRVLSHHPRWPELLRDAKTIASAVADPGIWNEVAVTGLGATGCPDALTAAEVAVIASALANVAARRGPPEPGKSGMRPSVHAAPTIRRSSK